MFEFISIGQILKPFRTEGDFLAEINPVAFGDLSNCTALFIKIDGIEVPFFIEEIELDAETCIVKLEEFNSPEDVKPFNGQKILLRKTDLSNPDSIQSPVKSMNLNGFKIRDRNSGKDFHILRTEEYPQQLMAVISLEDQEILIPLVEDFIHDIDASNSIITMELPEGILDI